MAVRISHHWVSALALATAWLYVAAPALAEGSVAADDTVSKSNASISGGLEEIIVTAERRTAGVQNTPIAISAVSGEMLQKSQIVGVEGLASDVPNLSFSQAAVNTQIFIRGIGLDAVAPGQDPRVAFYTDGVYNARPQGALNTFFDLDRVEVLRGPQGTLYGRNATAGTINVISRDPTDTLDGYYSLALGDYDLVRTEAAIGGPLAPGLSGRLAFQTEDHSGYGVNIETGHDVDNLHTRAVRGKLKYNPTDAIDFLLSADYFQEHDNNGGYHFLRNSPGYEDFSQALGFVVPTNPRDYAGQGPQTDISNYGTSITATFDLGGPTITSISAYRHLKFNLYDTADETTSNYAPLRNTEISDQYSQELRYGQTLGIVDVLVGGFAFNERNTVVDAAALSGAYFGFPSDALLQGVLYGGTQETDAFAAFSQETLHITSTLGFDIGGRYSNERRHITEYNQFDLTRLYNPSNGLLPTLAVTDAKRAAWDSFDPKGTLHYKMSDTIMTYITYSRGFKSGGFNIGELQPAFAPEKITDYEVGIKADFLDRRLRANLSAFDYKYTNLQVNLVEGVQLITTNAGAAKDYGAELELSALPTPELLIRVNLGWLHAVYTQYTTADPGRPQLGTLDLAGNHLSNAPDYKIDTNVEYTFHTTAGDITPRINAIWIDKVYFSQFNVDYNSQPKRDEINLFLDYDAGHGWTADGFIKNVTNKLYDMSGTVNAAFLGAQVVGQVGPPRTFGIALKKHF